MHVAFSREEGDSRPIAFYGEVEGVRAPEDVAYNEEMENGIRDP